MAILTPNMAQNGSFWAILGSFWAKYPIFYMSYLPSIGPLLARGAQKGHFGPFWAILGPLSTYGKNTPILGYFLCRYWPRMDPKITQNDPFLGDFGPFWGHFGPNTPYSICLILGVLGPSWPGVLKRAQNGQNGPFWPPGPEGPKSHILDHVNGPKWPKMALFGPKWPKMAIFGHFGPFWVILGQIPHILYVLSS